jgi:hypothetical protein
LLIYRGKGGNDNDGREVIREKRRKETKIRKRVKKERFFLPSSLMTRALLAI